MYKSNKRTKKVIYGTAISLIIAVVLLTGLGSFLTLKKENEIVPTNPLDWSVDAWDGASVGSEEFLADYGNRGKQTITIESAKSFMYFAEQVNNGNSYEGYTIYLNSNIDLKGNTIQSIGNIDRPFKGVFDGSYYTIMNANVQGEGLFGSIEDAEIKNLGVYNVNVYSGTNYAGGLVGRANSSSIRNSFVRLGSVNGTLYAGGLVGLFNNEHGVNNILTSFADTSVNAEFVGGLVGLIKTMDSDEALTTIQECYYVNAESSFGEVRNPQFYISNMVRKITSINDFDVWNYNADYTKGARWTKYAYAENSTKLDFNYPILSEFVKVYTQGSCYENVVFNTITGKSENVSSLSEAVAIAGNNSNNQINIIVNQIVVDNALELEDGADLKITASKDTTIVKGENVENLFVGSNNSNIVIGSEDSDAKIVIDGNNTDTGALIKTNGSNVTIHKNVVLQNNKNTNGFGGAIHIVNDEATPLSTELKNITIDKDVTITNCYATKGGAIYVEGNVNLNIGNNIYGNNAEMGKDIYFANKSVITLTEKLNNNLSIYMEGLKPYEETGRRNFDLSSIAVSSNVENDFKFLKLENLGLKTTNVLSEGCISAYNGTNYNITYNTDGGKHNNPTTYTCVDNVILGEAVKEGYTFIGWKEVQSETQLISNLEDEYADEIATGTLGNKEYEAEYQAFGIQVYYNYELSADGTYYTVSAKYAMPGESLPEGARLITEVVEIFGTYNGKPVKEVNGFTYLSDEYIYITTVIIGEGVETLGNYAFDGNSELRSVILPNTLKYIGSSFEYCTSLESITIPANVMFIENYAFDSCPSLTSVTFANPEGWTAGSTPLSASDLANTSTAATYLTSTYLSDYWTHSDVVAEPEYVAYILSEDGSYYTVTAGPDIGSCTELVIADEYNGLPVKEIAESAFKGNTTITSITIGENIIKIGRGSFERLTGVTELNFNAINLADSEGVEYANQYGSTDILYSCHLSTLLNTTPLVLNIGKNVKRIPSYFAFLYWQCGDSPDSWGSSTKISTINFADDCACESIGEYAFTNTNVTSVNFGNNSSIASIESWAFGIKFMNVEAEYEEVECLTEISLPSSLRTIGDYAFYEQGIVNLVIPEGVESIGEYSFGSYWGFEIYDQILTNVSLPSTLKTIGSHAFYMQEHLVSVQLPEGLINIGRDAFGECYSLSNVTFLNTKGWKAGEVALSESDLSNKSTAATYLKSTYASETWTRSTNPTAVVKIYGPDGEITDGSVSAEVEYVIELDSGMTGNYSILFTSGVYSDGFTSRVNETYVEFNDSTYNLGLGYISGWDKAYCNFEMESGYVCSGFPTKDLGVGNLCLEEVEGVTIYFYIDGGACSRTDVSDNVTINFNPTSTKLSATYEAYVYWELRDFGKCVYIFNISGVYLSNNKLNSNAVSTYNVDIYDSYGGLIESFSSSSVEYDFASWWNDEVVTQVVINLKLSSVSAINVEIENTSKGNYLLPLITCEYQYNSDPMEGQGGFSLDFSGAQSLVYQKTGNQAYYDYVDVTFQYDYSDFDVYYDHEMSEDWYFVSKVGTTYTYRYDGVPTEFYIDKQGFITGDLSNISATFHMIDTGVSYDVSNGSYAIAEAHESVVNFLIIKVASEYNGLPVKEITGSNSGFIWKGQKMIEVILPSTIEKIGNWTFEECYNLTSVNIPASVTYIGRGAFLDTNLQESTTIIENKQGWMYASSSTATTGTPIDSLTAYGLANTYLSYYLIMDSSANFTFTLVENGNDDYYKVKASGTGIVTANIPSTYNGLPVREIEANGFKDCTSLTSVTIPSSVTIIGNYAFSGCTALLTLNYNGSVPLNAIQDENFIFSKAGRNSNSLIVNIGDNVSVIPDYFFCPIYDDNSKTYSATIKKVNFGTNSNLITIGYASFRYSLVYEIALQNCKKLQTISADAFKGCKYINNVYIPKNVTTIGQHAFGWCPALTNLTYDAINCSSFNTNAFIQYNNPTYVINLTFGSNVQHIPAYFDDYNVFNIGALYLADSNVKSIGNFAFYYNKTITGLSLPDGMTSIGQYAFAYTGISGSIAINTELIGDYAFSNTSLTSVHLYDGVTVLPSYLHLSFGTAIKEFTVDSNNPNFTAVNGVLYNKNQTILLSYPREKTGTSFTVPNSVVSLNSYAFMYNKNITTVTLNDGLVAIGFDAFYSCSNLSTVNIPSSVQTIGKYAFENTKLTSATFALTDNWHVSTSSDFSSITKVTIDSASAGATLLKTTYKNYYWVYKTEALLDDLTFTFVDNGPDDYYTVKASYDFITSADIPASYNDGINGEHPVTTIASSGFSGCKDLTSVTIPSSITSINYNAFSGCTSLTSIAIPSSVVTIGSSAFYNTGITAFSVDSANEHFASPDGVLMSKDGTVLYAYPTVSTATSYVVPDGVVTISNYAFYNVSNLTSVTLPSTLTQIGYRAFYGCSSLKSADFGNNTQNWIYSDYGFYNGSYIDVTVYNLTNKSRAAYGLTSEFSYYYLYKDANYAFEFIEQANGEYYVKLKSHLIKWIYHINIPTEYNGKPVTGICDNGFMDRPNISVVVIPSTIKYIGNYAFSGCTGLETIYYNAVECDDLNMYNNVFAYAGKSSAGITVVVDKNVKVIPDFLFCPTSDGTDSRSGLPKIVKIEFAEDNELVEIGQFAFRFLQNLTTVNLEDCENLTTIGYYAFRGDSKVTSITIPENVTYIGEGAFSWMTSLEVVNYKATAVADLESSIGAIFAAGGKVNVSNGGEFVVNISSNVTRIPAYLFGGKYDEDASVTAVLGFSDNITYIGTYAFNNSHFYNETYNNNTVLNITAEYIGERAFDRAGYGITTLTIGNNVKYIGNYAFAEFNYLTAINFNAEDLDNYEYLNVSDETLLDTYYSVMVSEGYNREDYTSVNPQLLRGVEQQNHIFNNAGILSSGITLNIGADVNYIPAYMFNTSIGGGGRPNVTSLNWHADTKATHIGFSAFRWLDKITEITIPETIQYMGGFAFYECLSVATINYNATILEDLNGYGYDDHHKLWYPGNYVFHNLGKNTLTQTFDENGEVLSFSGIGVTVNIGSNVTRIPAHLFHSTKSQFSYAPRITNINWGDESNVTYIGEYAFHNCGYLSTIVIPEKVVTIGNYAFANAYNATSVLIKSADIAELSSGEDVDGDGHGDGNNIFANLARNIVSRNDQTNEVFGECVLTFDVHNVNNYYGYNFSVPAYLMYCSEGQRPRITKVTCSEDGSKILNIGEYAFYQCYTLVTFEDFDHENANPAMGSGSIFDYAFYGCESLKYGDNGEPFVKGNFGYIYAYAFAYCSSLEVIDITAGGISQGAFRNCDGLTSIAYNATYDFYFGNSAFRWCTNVTSLTITTSSYFDSFSIDLPTDNYVFFGLGINTDGVDVYFDLDFDELYIELGYKQRLGDNFFYPTVSHGNNPKIKSLTIGEHITEIGENALRGVAGLTELTIPENITTLGKNAFYGMKDVKVVNYNAKKITTIVDVEFNQYGWRSDIKEYDVSNPTYMNTETRDAVAGLFGYLGNNGFDYTDFYNNVSTGVTVNFGSSVEYIPSALFLYSGYSSDEAPTPKITAVNFECNLTGKAIGNRAFDKLLFLKEISIPNGVTHIYEFTFYYCINLESVSLPTSLQYIGSSAFAKSTKLSTINLDMESLTEIKNEAFRETAIKDVTIPKNVTRIGTMAFYQSGIEKLTIPEDCVITEIANNAFAESALQELYINCDIATLGSSIFADCISLDTVILKSLTHVGESMFANDGHLRYFEGLDLTRIGQWAFAYAGGYWEGGEFVQVLETFLLDSPSDWFFTSNENYTGGNNCDWNTLSDIIAYPLDSNDLFYDTGYYYYRVEIFEYVLKDNDTPDDISDDYYAVKAGSDIGTVEHLVLPTEYRGLPVLEVAEPTEWEYGYYSGYAIGVFEGISSLKSITIPKQIRKISERAFVGCSGVKDIYYNAEDCYVDIGAFGSLSATIHIGEDVLIVPHGLSVKGGVRYGGFNSNGDLYIDGTTRELSDIKAIEFAENSKVTTIYSYAFLGAVNIKSLIIPASVNYLSGDLFNAGNNYEYDFIEMGYTFALESVIFESPRYWYATSYDERYKPVSTELLDYHMLQNGTEMVEYFVGEVTYSLEKGTPAYEITFDHGIGESETDKLYFEKYGELGWFDNVDCVGNGFTAMTIPTVTDTSYIFKGYFTEEGGNGTQVVNADGSFTNYKFTADSTVYALYENVAGYQVTLSHGTATSALNYVYYAKDGSGWYAERECTTAISKIDVLPVHNLESDGYEFTGYFTATEGGVQVIDANGNFVTDALITIEGPTTLYAQYYLSKVKYTLSNDETHYIASARSTDISGEVEILAEYKGLPVTEIEARGFQYCRSMTSVIIPDSITIINKYAFDSCSGLTSLTIPENVTTIDLQGFADCTNLVEINYNAINVTSYYNSPSYLGAFADAGREAEGITLTFGDSVETIPDEFMVNWRRGEYPKNNTINLKVLNIGKNVEKIGRDAFAGLDITTVNYSATNCADLTSGAFGSNPDPQTTQNITHIGTLNIADNVIHIPANLFYVGNADQDYYTYGSIGTINIGTGVQTIGTDAFFNATRKTTLVNMNATNLTSGSLHAVGYGQATSGYGANSTFFAVMNIADNVTNIPENFTSSACLNELNIGSGVTYIGNKAFYNSDNIKQVTFKDSGKIEYIGDYAFMLDSTYQTNTTDNMAGTFVGSDKLTYIGQEAFAGCTSLNIDLFDCVNLNHIGQRAFFNTRKLTKLAVGEGLTELGYQTFVNCLALTEINWNAINCTDFTLHDIGSNRYVSPLGDINNTTPMVLNIGAKVTRIPANFTYGRYGGYLHDDGSYHGSYTYYSTRISTINFADNSACTSIGEYAFINSGVLTVNWGANSKIEAIEDRAFEVDSYTADGDNLNVPSLLNGFVLPETLKTVGDCAFIGQTSITEITIPEKVESIGGYAFHFGNLTKLTFNAINCADGLGGIGWNASGLEVIIGPNVTIIPSYFLGENTNNEGFRGTSAKSITFLGNKVVSIGNYAFAGASKITELTLPSSLGTIGEYAFYNNSLTTITIPANVYQIGRWALHDVYTLQTAIFEITTGWSKGSKYYPSDAYKAISSTNMANTTTAAGYLHDGDPMKREAPTFTAEIKSDGDNSVAYTSDETITLTASASITDAATYQWYRDGQAIEGATNSTFVHNGLTCEVGKYSYTCIITIAGSSAESNIITITVTKGDLVIEISNGLSAISSIIVNGGETARVYAKFETEGNVLGDTITVSADKDGAVYNVGEILEKQSEIAITAGMTFVKDIVVTVSYAGDDNFNSATTTFTLSVLSVITLATDGNGTITHDDMVDNKVVVNEDGTVEGIKVSANENYGFYYYTVVGKTINETYYNLKSGSLTLTGGSFNLDGLTESVTVTAHFTPTITLNFKVTGGELKDYASLLTATFGLEDKSIKFDYSTVTGEYVATATAMADDTFTYRFAGETITDENGIKGAITSLTFNGEEVLVTNTSNISGNNGACALSKFTFEPGGAYEVVYTIVKAVKVAPMIGDNENETDGEEKKIGITINTPTVTIDDEDYVIHGSEISLTVNWVAEGYTFIGYKTDTTYSYIQQTGNELVKIVKETVEGNKVAYYCTAEISEDTASMRPMIFENMPLKTNNEVEGTDIIVNISGTLTHVDSGLKYTLTPGNFESAIGVPLFYGNYELEGSGITIKITYKDGTSSTVTSSNGVYKFEIDNTVTKVEIG